MCNITPASACCLAHVLAFSSVLAHLWYVLLIHNNNVEDKIYIILTNCGRSSEYFIYN